MKLKGKNHHKLNCKKQTARGKRWQSKSPMIKITLTVCHASQAVTAASASERYCVEQILSNL